MSYFGTVQVRGPLTAFGEVQTASPGNRFDCEFIYDEQPLIIDDASSGSTATVTHDANSRDVVLGIGAADDEAHLRGHYWVPYTPGSGQEIDLTGALDASGVGGGVASYFLRTTVTGSTTETEVTQGSWLKKTSGVDWADSQIFRMTFQSLKVGTINFYLVSDGEPVKVGAINNDNVRETGFWQYPTLPPYWKLYTSPVSGGNTIAEIGYGDDYNAIGFRYTFSGEQFTATLRAICTTVKSQGGLPLFQMPGFHFAATETTAVTVSTTEVPIISIQPAATFNSLENRALAIPEGFDLTTNNPILWRLRYRPTLTGASFGAVNATYSMMNFDTTASAVTGGIVVASGFAGERINQSSTASGGFLDRVIMSMGSTGTSDILTLTAVKTGTSDGSVLASLRWREIR